MLDALVAVCTIGLALVFIGVAQFFCGPGAWISLHEDGEPGFDKWMRARKARKAKP